MELYNAVVSNNPDKWQTAAKLIEEAQAYVRLHRNSNDPAVVLQLIINSLCIAIYYAHENPNQADRYISHKNHFLFAINKQALLVLNLEQQKILCPLWNELANFYFSHGQTNNTQHNFGMAAEYFCNAISLYKLSNATNSLAIANYNYATTLYNQAIVLLNTYQFTEALPVFKQAAALLTQQNEKPWRSRCEYYIGFCLVEQGHYNEAISYFENAIPLYQEDRLRERQAGKLNQTAAKLETEQKNNLAYYFFNLAKRTLQNIHSTNTASLALESNNDMDINDAVTTEASYSQPTEMPSYGHHQLTLSA